jgi:hypothetical protein
LGILEPDGLVFEQSPNPDEQIARAPAEQPREQFTGRSADKRQQQVNKNQPERDIKYLQPKHR